MFFLKMFFFYYYSWLFCLIRESKMFFSGGWQPTHYTMEKQRLKKTRQTGFSLALTIHTNLVFRFFISIFQFSVLCRAFVYMAIEWKSNKFSFTVYMVWYIHIIIYIWWCYRSAWASLSVIFIIWKQHYTVVCSAYCECYHSTARKNQAKIYMNIWMKAFFPSLHIHTIWKHISKRVRLL